MSVCWFAAEQHHWKSMAGFWLKFQCMWQMANEQLITHLHLDAWLFFIFEPCLVCFAFPKQDINTLRPRQNGRHFPDDIFKCIFLNESVWISINISLMFVLGGPINDIPALVQVMAWRRPGDKPLSEPMMIRLPTHICVTRPQWVNGGLCSLSAHWWLLVLDCALWFDTHKIYLVNENFL